MSGHAVVIGAGIGGLLMARALSDTYDRVTVYDRDALPAEPVARRGVPQSRHAHALLSRGRDALEELFPGLTAQLAALGVASGDGQADVSYYNNGHLVSPGVSGLIALGVSRPLLEHTIRTRVTALPGVSVVDSCAVPGLTTTPGRERVTGVRLADGTVVDADLVVDAAGRGSRSPHWLAELGYPVAPEEQIRVGITYVTRRYRREPHHLDGRLGVILPSYPGQPHGGAVGREDADRLVLGIQAMLGEEPPTDDEGMAAFADGLASPVPAAIIRSAEPLGPPVAMRYPSSVRRRYEKLSRFPAGYLVVADALCSFNPIYAQGMTVAALEAVLLRRLLAEGAGGTGGPARRFFRDAAKLIDSPWAIAAGSDLRFPQIEGSRPAGTRLVNAYLDRYHEAAAADPVLGTAFLRVANLVDPPARLFAPRLVVRVLRRRRPA